MIPVGMRYNAENVRYRATPWLTGDGSTSSGTLLDRHGNPISSGKLKRVDAIHRTDWQGRQLLYATARTNLLINSIWGGSVSTPTGWSSGIIGGGTRTRLTSALSSSSGEYAWQFASATLGDRNLLTSNTVTVVPGDIIFSSVYVEAVTGTIPKLSEVFNLNGSPAGTVFTYYQDGNQVTGNTFVATGRISLKGEINTGGSFTLRYGLGVSSGAAVGSVTLSHPSAELGKLTPWIASTSAGPVTITDYTLTGPSVALGQVPDAGAWLDWDGVAER